MEWKSATESLPRNHAPVVVKYRGRYYEGYRNHDSVNPAMYIDMPHGSVLTRDCAWLEESSPIISTEFENQQNKLWYRIIAGPELEKYVSIKHSEFIKAMEELKQSFIITPKS